MEILHEVELRRDLARLSSAWKAAETFVFLPEKPGIDGAWIDRAARVLPADLRAGHFALLTSGTTGEPKLVVTPRERSERLVRVLHELQESEPVLETILALPLTYSYAFVNQWLWATVHGRSIVPTRGFGRPESLGRALCEARASMICLVGVHVPLFARFFQNESFPGVQRVRFAGGRFPQEKLDAVRRIFPCGSHSSTITVAPRPCPGSRCGCAEESEDAATSRRPLPGVELKFDESEQILFRSAYGAVGVVSHVGFSAIAPETWVRTGDLGRPTRARHVAVDGASQRRLQTPRRKSRCRCSWPRSIRAGRDRPRSIAKPTRQARTRMSWSCRRIRPRSRFVSFSSCFGPGIPAPPGLCESKAWSPCRCCQTARLRLDA